MIAKANIDRLDYSHVVFTNEKPNIKITSQSQTQRSEYAHSTKDKRIRLVGTCRKVPLVLVASYFSMVI